MSRLETLARTVRRCRKCRLWKGKTKAVPGEGPATATIFFVGEAPGREEDLTGRPFVGAAGKVLTAAVEAAGLRRSEVFIGNVNKCRPPGNRRPRADEVEACRPYLVEQIDEIGPKVFVALGQHSLACLTGSREGISIARRRRFTYHGIPVVATYHPAAVLYNRRLSRTLAGDVRRAVSLARGSRPRRGGLVPMRGKPYKTRVSSGGVPWDGGREFLLIRRRDEGIWCFPKGTVERGESLETTALRELREEAGIRGRILRDLGAVHYIFYDPDEGVNIRKAVHYLLIKSRQKRVKLESRFEDARWCTYRQAAKLLHYENDKQILSRAWRAARDLA